MMKRMLCAPTRPPSVPSPVRVMVLERGELMEYAAPLDLLNDPSSLFYSLCNKTGALEQLKETAKAEQEEKLARAAGAAGGGGSGSPPSPPPPLEEGAEAEDKKAGKKGKGKKSLFGRK